MSVKSLLDRSAGVLCWIRVAFKPLDCGHDASENEAALIAIAAYDFAIVLLPGALSDP